MSSPLDTFLDAHLPLRGIVACAIRLTDRSVITRRDGDAMTTAQIEQCLSRLTIAAEGFKRHRFEVKTLSWTFDQARIQLTRRPDGAQLAIFSTNVAGEAPNEGACQLIAAFQELSEG